MKISQSAREAAQNLWTKMFMRTSNVPNWLLSGIAAAEARGREEMREMAAKCAADVILRARTGDIDTDLRSIGYILQGDIRALPIGES